MTKFHDLTPSQALAAQKDRLNTLIVPLKVQPPADWAPVSGQVTPGGILFGWHGSADVSAAYFAFPFAPGDRIVCREDYYLTDDGDTEFPVYAADVAATQEHLERINVMAPQIDPDVVVLHQALRSAHTMPEWASRLTLEVTGVTVRKDEGLWAAHYGVTKL